MFAVARPAWAIPPNGQQQLLVETGGSILSFDPFTGASYGSFTTSVPTPEGMAIGRDGEVYVCSVNTNTVLRYDLHTGTLLGQFTSSPSLRCDHRPGWECVCPERVRPARSASLRPDGTSLGTITNDSRISPARTLTFGPDGNIYVGATGIGVVQKFSGTTGAFLSTFAANPAMKYPWSLTFGPDGDMYVLDPLSSTDCVWRFDDNGTFLDKFTSGGALDSPWDLAFGKDGNLYVSNTFGDGIDRFNSQTGAFMDTFIPMPGGTMAGDMVFNPEPCVGLVGLGMLAVMRRRRR